MKYKLVYSDFGVVFLLSEENDSVLYVDTFGSMISYKSDVFQYPLAIQDKVWLKNLSKRVNWHKKLPGRYVYDVNTKTFQDIFSW